MEGPMFKNTEESPKKPNYKGKHQVPKPPHVWKSISNKEREEGPLKDAQPRRTLTYSNNIEIA